MLSGLYPPRHGVRDNGMQALPAAAETIAERALFSGRRTGAFVSSAVLDRAYGLDQGFEVYDQPELGVGGSESVRLERDALATVERFAAWLGTLESHRPFFAWLHLYDPHAPYEPPEEVLGGVGEDPYLGEIAWVDRAVARMLEVLGEEGRDGRTWVVVTADHGEALGEHGEPTHGALCYDATMRVPLLFRPPAGVPPPLPGDAKYTSVVDLHPTLLGLMGLGARPGLDGVDLFASDDPLRGVYLESYSGYLHYGWSPLAGWVDGFGKYLHSSEPELYLHGDPMERNNALAGRERESGHARERISRVYARERLVPDRLEPGGELQRALWALGYPGGVLDAGELPSPLEESDRPSPQSRVHELDLLHRAEGLMEGGDAEGALALVTRIVEENPDHLLALELFALGCMHAERWSDAEEALRRRTGYEPDRADVRVNLALCLEARGAVDEALGELERAASLNAHESVITEELARLRAKQGASGGR